MTLPPHRIIEKAWEKSGLSQDKFALKYNIKQYNLSKYINRRARPPDELIMHCMHILGMISQDEISVSELTKLISDKLSHPEQSVVRKAIYDLVSNL